jgi:crossover junction endodeoxyribonuclease RusA
VTAPCNRCRERPKVRGLGWCQHCLDHPEEKASKPVAKPDVWRCWLPFPPSLNNIFTQGVVRGKVRRFPSKRYKAWREEAVIRLRANWRTRPPFPVPVVVKLELVPRDARPRDADNFAKPVLDALVEARVLVDDSNRHVKAVIPYWENSGTTSGVIVTIRPAADTRKPALTPSERRLLAAMRKDRLFQTMDPDYRPSIVMQGLIEKGYVRPLPGLIEGFPQGYIPA